jgi:hypothetical protein
MSLYNETWGNHTVSVLLTFIDDIFRLALRLLRSLEALLQSLSGFYSQLHIELIAEAAEEVLDWRRPEHGFRNFEVRRAPHMSMAHRVQRNSWRPTKNFKLSCTSLFPGR